MAKAYIDAGWTEIPFANAKVAAEILNRFVSHLPTPLLPGIREKLRDATWSIPPWTYAMNTLGRTTPEFELGKELFLFFNQVYIHHQHNGYNGNKIGDILYPYLLKKSPTTESTIRIFGAAAITYGIKEANTIFA